MACLLSRFVPSRSTPPRTFTVPVPCPDSTNETSHFHARRNRVLQRTAEESSPAFVPNGIPSRFLRVDYNSSPGSRLSDQDFFNLCQPLSGFDDYHITTYVHRGTGAVVQIAQVEFDTQANATRGAASLHIIDLDGSPLRPTYLPECAYSWGEDMEAQNPDLEILPQSSSSTVVEEDAIRPPARKKPKLSMPVKTVCKICTSEITGSYSKPCLRCKQPWCLDCVKTWFIHATQDSERMPARCCNLVLHHGVAGGTLSAVEFDLYKLRYDERTTVKPLYCPVPTCSTFIPPRLTDSSQGTVNCTLCATRICTKCKQLAATDHVCEEEAATTKIMALNYKTCPKCGTGIMKMYGCPHVRCVCGAHICWDCMRALQVCNRSPCASAIEDGQYRGEEDGDVSDSEDDVEDPGILAERAHPHAEPVSPRSAQIGSLGAPNAMQAVLNIFRGRRQRRADLEERRRLLALVAQLRHPSPQPQRMPEIFTLPRLTAENSLLPETSTPGVFTIVEPVPATLPNQALALDAPPTITNPAACLNGRDSEENNICSCLNDECRGGPDALCSRESRVPGLPDLRTAQFLDPLAPQTDTATTIPTDSTGASVSLLESSLAADPLAAELPFASSSNTDLHESDFWARPNPALIPTSPVTEPTTPNLDDPDLLDWEAEDYDFGEEPVDESFDVWGCACNFSKLKKDTVDECWIQDMKYLDCMKCFGEVILQTTPQLFSGMGGVKKFKDKLAWHCGKCGVVVCGKCERAKRNEMKALMRANGTNQN